MNLLRPTAVLFIFLLPIAEPSAPCKIDNIYHGIFKNSQDTEKKISITSTSISGFGECYESYSDSYIMGQRRMGRDICFKCVTLVVHTDNVLQITHRDENICFSSIQESKSSCFAANQLTLHDGLLLIRSETPKHTGCNLDSKFALAYSFRNNERLYCDHSSGSSANNCEASNILKIHFTNCSFPDFNTSFRCYGTWTNSEKKTFIMLENMDTDELRCGIVDKSSSDTIIYMAKDATCSFLSSSSYHDSYILRPSRSLTATSTCVFPDYLQGTYRNLRITNELLEYNENGNGNVPVYSYCLSIHGDRIHVFSETKCGEPIGYHCFWFKPRSDSVLEFTMTLPTETSNATACEFENNFATSSWTTAVTEKTIPSACGLTGKFRTPADIGTEDCFEVGVDCSRTNSLRISAYRCQTGVYYDERIYDCVASWKENNYLFTYTTRNSALSTCFTTLKHDGRIYMSSSGVHCSRTVDFQANSSKTIVLEEFGTCRSSAKSKSAKLPSKAALREVKILKNPDRVYNPENTTVDMDAEAALLNNYQTSSCKQLYPSLVLLLILGLQ